MITSPKEFNRLTALAENAATLPVTRIWLAFFRPDMGYEKGSDTLAGTGFEVGTTKDKGFAAVKSAIQKLQKGGVEVFLSAGGWDYNCFPYAYAQYSIAGYGAAAPNFWHIQKYAGGDVSNSMMDLAVKNKF